MSGTTGAERRLLLISGEYPPMRGGVADYTERLVEALDALGWEAHVLTSTAAAANSNPRARARLPRWGWSLPGQVRHNLRETGAGILHIQYQTGAFGMHPAINILPYQIRRLPVVTTFHDLRPPYLFPKAGPLRGWATRLLAGGSDAVIVTNDHDRRELERGGRLRRRLATIPIGSNLPPAPDIDPLEVRGRLGIDPRERAVGFFGFLTHDKGVDLLLDAVETLDDRRVRLVIVGGGLAETDISNAGYYTWLSERLSRAGVPVTRTGHLPADEAAAALAALDLIVLPFRGGASLRRGTLLAAAASGAPVLTTDPGAGESLTPLRPGESLWLVPSDDAAALREGIRTLLENRQLAERLGRTARRESAAFDWDEIARRHVAIYERLLDGKPPLEEADRER